MEKEKNKYDFAYHLVPTISEGAVSDETLKLREFIEKEGAVILTETKPENFKLCYTIIRRTGGAREKFDVSYFGSMIFEAESGVADKIKSKLEGNKNIIRFLIVKGVAEKTKTSPPKKIISEEEKPEEKMSTEDMDKEIDKLVV